MIKTILKIFAALIVLSIGLGAAWFVAELQPKGEKVKIPNYGNQDQLAKELIAKSLSLEDEYKASVGINEPTAEDIKTLIALVDAINEYTKVVKFPDRLQLVRMREFNKIIESFQSKEIYINIGKLITQAEEAAKAQNFKLAEDLYKQAENDQINLNINYPDSMYASHFKASSFAREIKLLSARPLFDATMQAEVDAKEAIKNKDWDSAKIKYEIAIDIQRNINKNFPDLRYSDLARVKSLENEQDTLQSLPAKEKIDSLFASYEKSMQEHQFIEATEFIQDAIILQQELNARYPNSKNASQNKVHEWTTLKDTAMSTKEALAIVEQIKNLDAILASSHTELAEDSIETVMISAEKFRAAYPANLIINDDHILKLRYLNFIKDNITDIQKEVKNNLHNKVFANKWLLMKSEVWQALYQAVMQNNPSKDKSSPLNPVEFVTKEDIQNFTLRLSWILAKEVKLPTQDIFKEAIGDMKYVNLKEIAWYDTNSNNKIQPIMTSRPNDTGFFDLLGNVSEFIDDEKQISIGGDVNSNSDDLLHLGNKDISKQPRSPFTGFRVIISN